MRQENRDKGAGKGELGEGARPKEGGATAIAAREKCFGNLVKEGQDTGLGSGGLTAGGAEARGLGKGG